MQIIHSLGNHWIVATNIGCAPKFQVFDTLYSSVDKATTKFLTNLFGPSIIQMRDRMELKTVVSTQLQCVALANEKKPGQFIQEISFS